MIIWYVGLFKNKNYLMNIITTYNVIWGNRRDQSCGLKTQ
jgi:hypothetical protein